MRTWEMIKELMENPNKEFSIKLRISQIAYVSVSGNVRIRNINRESKPLELTRQILDEKWEEVRRPVDFMTVAKAVKEGKEVGLKYDGFSLGFTKWELRDLLIDLGQNYEDEDLAEIILKGKWYIED